MIYCPNFDCAKPRNQKRASFCSHCGTPLKIGDRFSLTAPLGQAGQSFFAIDHHLPSQPRCIVTRREVLQDTAGWTPDQLRRLEALSNQGHLPRLLAMVDCPQAKGRSAEPSQLFAHAWIEGTSLAELLAQNGAMTERMLRQYLTAALADLVQLHDQGFVHGDICPSTLIQQSGAQEGCTQNCGQAEERRGEQQGELRLWAASYREIAPICETAQPAQRTQDLQRLQYWAPERKLGQAVPASDIYSLGVSAIRLLTAQPLEQLFDVAEDCWCWEESLETPLSDDFCHLLNSMLERATRRRYSSAVDVLRDLAHLNELAELAELAEPIAPLQPSIFNSAVDQASPQAGQGPEHLSGDAAALAYSTDFGASAGAASSELGIAQQTAPKQISEKTTIPLEESDIETLPLALETSGQGLDGEEPERRRLASRNSHREDSDSQNLSGQDLENRDSDRDRHSDEDLQALEGERSQPSQESSEAARPETNIEASPSKAAAPDSAQATSESKAIARQQAQQSLAESLETLSDSPQAASDPAPSPRRSRQSTGELVARVLDNPLTLSIGGLVQQLAQRHSAGGATYVPWEIMKALKQLKRSPETEPTFARHLLEMADFYRDQVNQGHRDLRRLVVAIIAYEQVLTILDHAPEQHSPEQNDLERDEQEQQACEQGTCEPGTREPRTCEQQIHEQWLSACHDLGRMYLALSRQHPSYRVACIKQSVETFQRGLSHAGAESDAYLALQNQLGEAYGTLAASEEPVANWQGAIAAYQAALAVCPAELADEQASIDRREYRNECHGAIQNNLGTALWNLSLYDSSGGNAAGHLQGAIAAYQAALAHHDPEADPVRFGMIQNNLGTAYLNLAQSEKSLDLLRLAVGTYQVALLYRKRSEVPLAHAATQNNLGAASLQLASHQYADPQTQREGLEQSIIAYEAALMLVCELSAAGAMSIGFDPAASRLNLALAHQRRGCSAESVQDSSVIFAHLETAMQIYLDLLEKQPKGSDIHEMALEYLSQTMHHLSEHLYIADDHPLLKQVPNQVVAEMSQQFQRQLQEAS